MELVGRSYYYKKEKDITFYRINKATKSKRDGVKDTLLEVSDYKLDYELNELVETGSGLMWYSALKEDYKSVTKAMYDNIQKNVSNRGNSKMRFLYKIEVK